MFAHIWTRAAGIGRPRAPSSRWIVAIAAAPIVLLGACSQTPPSRFAGPDPSAPQTSVPTASYRSVVGPYASQRPAEPLPWREQNDRATPAAQP